MQWMSLCLPANAVKRRLALYVANAIVVRHHPTTGFSPWTTPILQHRQLAAKTYYKLRKKKQKPDPWSTLGISKDDSYQTAKKKFLKIAMDHHPDTSTANTTEQEEKDREIFVAARSAFEMLTAGPKGAAVLREDSEKAFADEANMDEWFRHETGFDMPFMDAATMREVAKVTQQIGGDTAGLDRDGGMWTLARMVTENVKQGGDGKSLLALEAGDETSRKVDGELRRRRRR